MTTPPGADERRIQYQLRTRGVSYAPQPPSDARDRDWLDDLWDDDRPPPRAAVPPQPPDTPPPVATEADEPRWDWSRLLRWPYARPTCGAGVALLPFFGGQSAATGWGSVLLQARTEAGVGAAWVIAGVGLGIGALCVRGRRTWWAYGLLTSAFIGTIAMASPLDLVRFVTGAF